MKATSLLRKQHKTVQEIFAKLERGRAKVDPLLETLANDLAAHMAIEQEIFYPAVREVDADLIAESFEEHALAEVALKRLLATPHNDPAFKARVTATKELIDHHVHEEQDELFPKVEKALGDKRLLALGAQMKARFDEVVAAGFEAAVPKGFSRTSSDLALRKSHKVRPAA